MGTAHLLSVCIALVAFTSFSTGQTQILNLNSCTTLAPETTTPAQNPADNPYGTVLSTQSYTAGMTIDVTFQSLLDSETTFQEIIVQGRRTNDNTEPVGNFMLVNGQTIANNADYTILNCPLGVFGSTVATSNATLKSLPLSFSYQAPNPTVGSIRFFFTIVQQSQVYYQYANSEEIVDTSTAIDVTPPTITGCPSGITEMVEFGVPGTIVNWVEPTAIDGSGTASIVSRSSVPGSFFTDDKTTIVYIFQDETGNSANCEFCITLIIESPGNFAIWYAIIPSAAFVFGIALLVFMVFVWKWKREKPKGRGKETPMAHITSPTPTDLQGQGYTDLNTEPENTLNKDGNEYSSKIHKDYGAANTSDTNDVSEQNHSEKILNSDDQYYTVK